MFAFTHAHTHTQTWVVLLVHHQRPSFCCPSESVYDSSTVSLVPSLISKVTNLECALWSILPTCNRAASADGVLRTFYLFAASDESECLSWDFELDSSTKLDADNCERVSLSPCHLHSLSNEFFAFIFSIFLSSSMYPCVCECVCWLCVVFPFNYLTQTK